MFYVCFTIKISKKKQKIKIESLAPACELKNVPVGKILGSRPSNSLQYASGSRFIHFVIPFPLRDQNSVAQWLLTTLCNYAYVPFRLEELNKLELHDFAEAFYLTFSFIPSNKPNVYDNFSIFCSRPRTRSE